MNIAVCVCVIYVIGSCFCKSQNLSCYDIQTIPCLIFTCELWIYNCHFTQTDFFIRVLSVRREAEQRKMDIKEGNTI